MKLTWTIKYGRRLSLVIYLILSLTSCEMYHFEKPQPVDGENIYQFPKEFRGSWQDDKRESIVTIGKNEFSIAGGDAMKVVNAISNRRDTAWNRYYLKTIRFNKETNRNDTVVNYVLKSGKIYEIRQGGLERGFPYVLKNDTLYFKKEIFVEFELNRKSFLRKLTDTSYILNLHEESLGPLMEGRTGPWWQIVLLEKMNDGKIKFRQVDVLVKENSSRIYSKGDDYYFDVSWTRQDLLKLVNRGLFERGKEGLQRIVKTPAAPQ